MKKLILAFAIIGSIGIAAVPAHAQDSDPVVYPPTTPETTVPVEPTTTTSGSVLPPTTTTPVTTVPAVTPPSRLPRTGSGVSSILGIGALLLLAGGVIVVAARRRSTATNPAA